MSIELLDLPVQKEQQSVQELENRQAAFISEKKQLFRKLLPKLCETRKESLFCCFNGWGEAGRLLSQQKELSAYEAITFLSEGSFTPVHYFHGYVDTKLEQTEEASYHVIHLSNITDWLSAEEATKTLELAYHALKPGGVVIIRQLNSTLDIPSLNYNFEWDRQTAKKLLENDPSFFYRNFFIGVKPATSLAPRVQELTTKVLSETPILEGPYFQHLSTMSKEQFQKTQKQFFFAVDYFSRPMSTLVGRIPLHKDRIDIIENIVEEHGSFSIDQYHSTTFKKFLQSIGVSKEELLQEKASAPVNSFNYALMGVSASEDPIVAIACLGIIEHAFAHISSIIGQTVVERGWVKREELIHYNLHSTLDVRHAEEFFKIIEPYTVVADLEEKILSGLRLGLYIFDRLYTDLFSSPEVAPL